MSVDGVLSRFWLWELTRPAFEDWLDKEPAPVVVLGIGSIEQHGPQLPLGMDSLGSQFFVHEVAKRTNSVALCPTFPGYSPHHMGFRGTVTLSDQTLLMVLMDTIGSLADHGVKRFVISNHHGGNTQIMNLAIQLSKREYRVMVHAPTGPSNTELAKMLEDRQKRFWDVHSGPTETSSALLNFPELVEMWRLKDWKPTLKINPKLKEFMDPGRSDFEVVSQVRAACSEPDTDDFTSSGVYGTNDPRTASVEEAKRRFEERVGFFVDFIKQWKKIPVPPAYQ
ncbi:MAG: creatininase family protein [Candidatus Bathyarchaeota archaeon]|nr:creatininase family protein [Candidatus Bathyarchaeota archaeon]